MPIICCSSRRTCSRSWAVAVLDEGRRCSGWRRHMCLLSSIRLSNHALPFSSSRNLNRHQAQSERECSNPASGKAHFSPRLDWQLSEPILHVNLRLFNGIINFPSVLRFGTASKRPNTKIQTRSTLLTIASYSRIEYMHKIVTNWVGN